MIKKQFVSVLATASIVLAGLSTGHALAWHPVGKITKQVENQTTKSQKMDADTTETALDVKTGDILEYHITVRNDGTPDASGNNDMGSVVLKDTLPEGIELIANPSQREITVDLGTIKAGDKVTKSYEVKVVSTTNKQVVTNKACFTGDSLVNDNAQAGCDDAVVKLNIPQTSSTTTTTPTPPAPVTPAPVVKAAVTTKTLPKTGSADTFLVVTLVTIAGVLVAQVRMRRSANSVR